MMYNNKQVHIAFNPWGMMFIDGERLKPSTTLKIIDNFGRPLVAFLTKQGDGGEYGEWWNGLSRPPERGCYFTTIYCHPRFDPNNCRVFSESELNWHDMRISQSTPGEAMFFVEIEDAPGLPLQGIPAEPGEREDSPDYPYPDWNRKDE